MASATICECDPPYGGWQSSTCPRCGGLQAHLAPRAKPGDWMCTRCHSSKINFAGKTHCWTCRKPRDDQRSTVATSSSLSSGASPTMESGDWFCAVCKSPKFNFRTKMSCFTCRATRAESDAAALATASTSSASSSTAVPALPPGHPHHDAVSDDDDEDEGMCVVCKERPSEWFNPACNHLCACGTCKSNLKTCPMCRAPAPPTGFVKIFFS